jgi:hypothetical protein
MPSSHDIVLGNDLLKSSGLDQFLANPLLWVPTSALSPEELSEPIIMSYPDDAVSPSVPSFELFRAHFCLHRSGVP